MNSGAPLHNSGPNEEPSLLEQLMDRFEELGMPKVLRQHVLPRLLEGEPMLNHNYEGVAIRVKLGEEKIRQYWRAELS